MTSTPRDTSAADAPDALPAGFDLDGFRIERVIATREFGIVYQAHDLTLDCAVALKEYFPSALARRHERDVVSRTSGQEEAYQQGLHIFVQEAQMLARCDHPSLLRVTRLWRANGTAYRAMPQYTGKTLIAHRHAMGEPPSEAWLRALVNDLCGALEVVHAAGLVHRRVMPTNILMRPDQRPVLLDFDAVRHALAHTSSRVQSLMAVVAPPAGGDHAIYEQPELPQTASSDLHSLAATVHFCITGLPPALGQGAKREPLEHIVAHLRTAHPGIDYSVSFIQAIDKALSPDPAQWPRNVTEFRSWLAEPTPVPAARAATPAKAGGGSADLRTDDGTSIDFMTYFAAAAAAPRTSTAAAPTAIGDRTAAARPRSPFDASRADTSRAAGEGQGLHFFPLGDNGAAPSSSSSGPVARPGRPAAPAEPTLGPAASGDGDAAFAESRFGRVAAAPAFRESRFSESRLPDPDYSRFDDSRLPDLEFDGLEGDAGHRLAPPERERSRRWLPWAVVGVLVLIAAAGGWKFQDELRHDRVLNELARTTQSTGSDVATAPAATPPITGSAPTSTSDLESSYRRGDGTTGTAVAPADRAVNNGDTHSTASQSLPAAGAASAPPPLRSDREVTTRQEIEEVIVSSPPEAGSARPDDPAPSRQAADEAPVREEPRARTPREACGSRTEFALYRCMQTQCAMARWSQHPSCQRLRVTDEVSG